MNLDIHKCAEANRVEMRRWIHSNTVAEKCVKKGRDEILGEEVEDVDVICHDILSILADLVVFFMILIGPFRLMHPFVNYCKSYVFQYLENPERSYDFDIVMQAK